MTRAAGYTALCSPVIRRMCARAKLLEGSRTCSFVLFPYIFYVLGGATGQGYNYSGAAFLLSPPLMLLPSSSSLTTVIQE